MLDTIRSLGVLSLLVAPALAQAPEVIHYTFDAGDATNTAVPGVGDGVPGPRATFVAARLGGSTTAASVVAGTADPRISTGWAPAVSGDWTIGTWLDLSVGGGGFQYLFGDSQPSGGVRCYAAGSGGAGNLTLRGAFTEVVIPGGAPAIPVHAAFCFDSSVPEIRGYLNGMLAVTVPQTAAPITAANFFVLGGNSASSGTATGNVLDDFRVYSRCISASELAAWAGSCGVGGYLSSCAGDGGNQLGCTFCPCGNDAPAGTVGGCNNSAGRSARLNASGNASVAADTLRLEMTGGTSVSFGVLTSGAAIAPTNPASPCFGLNSGVTSVTLDGLRCAVQSVQRHGARPSDASGDIGLTTNGWGPPSGPAGGILAQGGFVAGETRHFQVIYREQPTLGCQTGQNTSQLVSVTVQP